MTEPWFSVQGASAHLDASADSFDRQIFETGVL
jgi:hypothetical protein